ncbi:MAG: hypothetical protein ACPH3J_10385, partial [Planktomarina sp.]
HNSMPVARRCRLTGPGCRDSLCGKGHKDGYADHGSARDVSIGAGFHNFEGFAQSGGSFDRSD